MQLLVTVAPTTGAPSAGSRGRAGGAAHDPSRWSPSRWDAHALEAAVRLGETHDAEVVAATVGPPGASVLRAALARGADRAVRVWDDRLDGDALLDPRVRARLLAAVAADVAPTLVFAGARSGPDGFGATGVALAATLEYGWATVVTDLSLDREAGVVSVRCDRDGDRTELVDVDLPAVLTVGTGCNEPRHAGLGAVRAAQRADVVTRSLADLDCDPAAVEPALTPVETVDRDRAATIFEGSTEAMADDLAAVLRAHGVEP